MLDLRLPSGLFFAIVGLILIATSFTNPVAPMMGSTEPGSNVDLYAGLFMLVFGAILLLLARRSGRA
jgi:hypothetical protein